MPDPENETTQEPADIKRLIAAGLANDDPETTSAGVRRAFRLTQRGMPLDATAASVLGLDKLDKDDD